MCWSIVIHEPSFGHWCARMDVQMTALMISPATSASQPGPLGMANSDRTEMPVSAAPVHCVLRPGKRRRIPLEAITIASPPMQTMAIARPPRFMGTAEPGIPTPAPPRRLSRRGAVSPPAAASFSSTPASASTTWTAAPE